MKLCLFILTMIMLVGCATPQPVKETGFDAQLSTYQYPFEVKRMELENQGQKLSMAYMDLVPTGAPKGTIVLLHGKNFGGFYFDRVAKDLLAKNYRIIIPDQIGFGKSSKPDKFQYSFHQLAKNTFSLLDSLATGPIILVGHSMGGMLGTRMALMRPETIKKLILINPIGLEDYKVLTHYKSVDELYQMELQNTPEKIKQYQVDAYYAGNWKPEYEPLIVPAVGWTQGKDFSLTAKVSALTSEMAYSQPVVYEFSQLKVATVLIMGQRDRTALGKGWASESNKKIMGNYPALGKKVKRLIPHSKLIALKGIGHVPFIEDYDLFMKHFWTSITW